MTRPIRQTSAVGMAAVALAAVSILSACSDSGSTPAAVPAAATTPAPPTPPADAISEGRQVFRFETFGDEQVWTDRLRMHEAVEKGLDPTTALKLGLKVDADVLPPGTLEKADLTSPATTVALLKLNAIVGLKATIDANDHITSIGVTCALCHSTVDNSVKAGIGRRLDGWPNRDLNVGAIIALSPALTPEKKVVYNSWGPGKYDPRYNQDGKNGPVVIPPAYGLAQINNSTYTGDGTISYWNAYVAVTQMGGRGNFVEPRLGIDVKHSPDVVSPKLDALRAYQHSLTSPPAPAGSFDQVKALAGKEVFDASCASCHVGGSGTDNNDGKLHPAADTGVDGKYAARSATKAYRTTPLRGLWQHPPYFHDGSAKTLADVVAHYNKARALGLTAAQQSNLIEYLKTR